MIVNRIIEEFTSIMNRILPVSLLVFLMAAIPSAAFGQACTTATCTAASANESDVLAALPSSSNTNATVVVNIPSGTASWSTGFTYTIPSAVTKLTIQGATGVNCTGTPGTSSWSCPANDSTVIRDAYTSNIPLMTFNTGGSSTYFRVTGITLEGGAIGSGSHSKYDGVLQIRSGAAQFRFDHNHCNWETYDVYQTDVCVRSFAPLAEAVADHNLCDNETGSNYYSFCFSVNDAYGDTLGNGDGTFANPTPWGQTSGVFFVEDNYMNGGVINDCADAGSMVVRDNYFNHATVAVQTHGTKSEAGPGRGCRSIEVYDNYGTNSGSSLDALVGTKGTTALFWNNTMAAGYYNFYHGQGDRESGDATETNAPNGWGYCGTAVNGNGAGSPWDGNPNTSTGYPCLDGLGRGQDVQHLNGADFPNRLNSSTGTIAWSHQYLEPQYLWGNSIGSANEMEVGDDSVNNRDYYYDCGPRNSSCSGGFTGTAGTGYGTLANRPSACTAGTGGTYGTSPTGSYGVGYFATDANSGRGELYVCTATNTWTGIYEPAAYPHPLDGGVSGTTTSPDPPTGLAGTVN